MSLASYINLNYPYLLISMLFFGIALMLIFWMHIRFYVKTAENPCANPLTMYFDKETALKCAKHNMEEDAENIKSYMDNQFSLLTSALDNKSRAYSELGQKYERLNSEKAEQHALFLRNKEAAIRDLATNVREIRDNIDANQGALDNMINDYKSVLQNNAKMLKNIASSIVDKLNRNIYKKNYGNERKKYVKGYDSIQKYMNKLVDEEMIDKDDSVLAPLSEIAKRGGK